MKHNVRSSTNIPTAISRFVLTGEKHNPNRICTSCLDFISKQALWISQSIDGDSDYILITRRKREKLDPEHSTNGESWLSHTNENGKLYNFICAYRSSKDPKTSGLDRKSSSKTIKMASRQTVTISYLQIRVVSWRAAVAWDSKWVSSFYLSNSKCQTMKMAYKNKNNTNSFNIPKSNVIVSLFLVNHHKCLNYMYSSLGISWLHLFHIQR